MEKQACASDAYGKLVEKAVLIDTNLQTHLVIMISGSYTVSDLKNKIQYEHTLCFPNVGKVKIEAIKVKHKGQFYHLSDSLVLGIAFDGFSKKRWSVHVDILPQDAQTHCFILPYSNMKNTSNAVVSHSPCDHPTHLSNFGNVSEPSTTYNHDQILLDASNLEKQVHSVMDYELLSLETRGEADLSGRGMNDVQLKMYVKETENVVTFDKKKKHRMKRIENSSRNPPKEILPLNTSSPPVAARETVSDDNDIKKEVLSVKNTHNVDVEEHPHAKPSKNGENVGASAIDNIIDHYQQVGSENGYGAVERNKTAQKQDSKSILSDMIKPSDDNDIKKKVLSVKNTHTVDVEEHPHAKTSKTGEKVGASAIDNIIDHYQQVGSENGNGAGEGNKTAQKQDSKSILSDMIKPSDEYVLDTSIKRSSAFSKGADSNVYVEPKKSSKRRKKKKQAESKEENVIVRDVIPVEDKEKDIADQNGKVNEKDDGRLEQFSEAYEIVENKDTIKKSMRGCSSESKIFDNLRKDGIGDNLSQAHHNQSVDEASKSETIAGENRRSPAVQTSKPKIDPNLEAILIPQSDLESVAKLPRKVKGQNHQFILEKLHPIKKASGSVGGLNNTTKKRSLLVSSVPIFKDDNSDSLEDQDHSYHSNWSTRTPSENSLSSAYSDEESNADSLIGKGRENSESLAGTDSLSDKKAVTIENVLRSSKRYKKAKLIASQMENTEIQPPEFVPDTWAEV